MNTQEITNGILEYFYNNNLKPELYLDIDDSVDPVAPQVQINIDLDGNNSDSFAIFYGLSDETINFSAIYELKSSITEEEFKEYTKANKVENDFFEYVMPDETIEEIHLYKEVKLVDFNKELLDDIVDFFKTSTAVQKLRELSK